MTEIFRRGTAAQSTHRCAGRADRAARMLGMALIGLAVLAGAALFLALPTLLACAARLAVGTMNP